jgi:hypothetical protein
VGDEQGEVREQRGHPEGVKEDLTEVRRWDGDWVVRVSLWGVKAAGVTP